MHSWKEKRGSSPIHSLIETCLLSASWALLNLRPLLPTDYTFSHIQASLTPSRMDLFSMLLFKELKHRPAPSTPRHDASGFDEAHAGWEAANCSDQGCQYEVMCVIIPRQSPSMG